MIELIDIEPQTFKAIEDEASGRQPRCPHCNHVLKPYVFNMELWWRCHNTVVQESTGTAYICYQCNDEQAKTLE